MHITVETLDDALLKLYQELLTGGHKVAASRGENSELLGVSISIEKPRARLSRSQTRGRVYSSLGELLWYLTADNQVEFIKPFIQRYERESEDGGKTVYGGYGPRLFSQRGVNQITNVIELLTKRPSSRRAMVQIFNAEDLDLEHKEIPCTATLQFLIRDERVHLIATMRSNDAYLGLPHDVFCFTMLQEIVARSINRDIGTYRHFAGSMHLYNCDYAEAEALVSEGFQPRIEMPSMPAGDPWPSIKEVLRAETRARSQEDFDAAELGLNAYWLDIIKLLQVFFENRDERKITIRESINYRPYRVYIAARIGKTA